MHTHSRLNVGRHIGYYLDNYIFPNGTINYYTWGFLPDLPQVVVVAVCTVCDSSSSRVEQNKTWRNDC